MMERLALMPDIQEELKILQGSSAVVFNDCRRIFILGLTIEAHRARFWHFNRGHICVSVPFDYHKVSVTILIKHPLAYVTQNPEWLIAYYLNQSYAPLPKLGYDPSVQMSVEKGPIPADENLLRLQWIYTLASGERYKTVGEPLSNDRSFFLLSRGVRVVTACKIGKDGTLEDRKVVLKDYHAYDDTQGEREIQNDIFHRLGVKAVWKQRGKPDRDLINPVPSRVELNLNEQELQAYTIARKEAQAFFLVIVHDDALSCSPALPEDHRRTRWTSQPDTTHLKQTQSSNIQTSSGRHDGDQSPKPQPITQDFARKQRRHRRVVFREVCEVIPRITNFHVVLRCTRDVVTGLSS
jgi:hypothetical protein